MRVDEVHGEVGVARGADAIRATMAAYIGMKPHMDVVTHHTTVSGDFAMTRSQWLIGESLLAFVSDAFAGFSENEGLARAMLHSPHGQEVRRGTNAERRRRYVQVANRELPRLSPAERRRAVKDPELRAIHAPTPLAE